MKKIRIDVAALKQRWHDLGIQNSTQCAKKTLIARSTIERALESGVMTEKSLEQLASDLGVPTEYLQPTSQVKRAAGIDASIPAPRDWEIEQHLTTYLTAPNGVAYCVAKLRSTVHERQQARGKFYALARLLVKDREQLNARLNRHSEVCERLKGSRRVVWHRGVYTMKDDQARWILDEWIDGPTLENLLFDRIPLSLADKLRIGTELLEGLLELHSAGIIFRELAPERILLAGEKDRCVLTDFEMAKILDKGTISVSDRWKDVSPYRAPEMIDILITSTNAVAGYRCDLFSWGRIMRELFVGSPCGSDEELFAAVRKGFAVIIRDCCNPQSRKRPTSVQVVLDSWINEMGKA